MNTLSKEAEEQVIAAVKRAVAAVDEQDLSPTDALAKEARDLRWGPDMIRFAAAAYNTGRQTAQRQSATTALDKFAAFPLADAAAVIGQLWPEKVASPGEVKAAAVSDEYSQGPDWLAARHTLLRRRRLLSVEKQAEDKSLLPPPARPTPAQTFHQHLRLKRAAQNARAQAAAAYDRLLQAADQLAGYFHKAASDRLPLAAVAFAARTYFGKAGSSLIELVRQRGHLKEAADARRLPLVKVSFDAAPFSYLRRCLDAAGEVNAARAAHAQAAQALEKHAFADLAPLVSCPEPPGPWSLLPPDPTPHYSRRALAPFLGEVTAAAQPPAKQAAAPEPQPAAWSLLDKAALDTASLGLGAWLKAQTDKALKKPDIAGDVQDAASDLEDPAHEAELRQIRTQAMLADLMNDEVLGGFPHENVLKAYNEIAQMAPRTAQQPLALRSLLRRHLQGNLEPFEATQLTELEKGLKDSTNPVPAPSSARILNDAPHSILG